MKRPLLKRDVQSLVSPSRQVVDIVLLAITTVVFAGDIVANILATQAQTGGFGFNVSTGNVPFLNITQLTPAGYTFSIWGVIYTWQGLWIAYAWSFVCRPSYPRTIFSGVYPVYTFVCLFNIAWLYTWGNLYPQVSLAFILLLAISLYVAIGMSAYYLYKKTEDLGLCDLWWTRILVLNGLAVYATWVSIASLLNIDIVIGSYSINDVSATSGTVLLSVLSAMVIAYFILENSILDRFARCIFIVYPVVIWALSGVLVEQWGKDGASVNRNNIFTLVLVIVVVILFILRIILQVLFAIFRPVSKPKQVV